MKHIAKKLLLTCFLLLFTATMYVGMAQSPPPPPGGGSNNGHDLVGNQGAAVPLTSPVNDGFEILLLMGAGYAGWNYLKRKKENKIAG